MRKIGEKESIMATSKKSVKINLGTINEESMAKLSAYHVARAELIRLREERKTSIEKVEIEIEELKKARKEALEQGEDTDTVIAKYDILPLTNKINAINEKFKEDCKPHNLAKKSALELIPDQIYHAYLLTMSTGNPSAKGTVVTKRDKDNKVKESVKVDKTMATLIKEFATTIGLGNADNESAISKFATIMATWSNGMIKANKGDDYLKVKSESQYKEIFMLAFLQYAIIEKKVIIVNEDNTLAMRDFSK
jgi:hypothetical protein